VIRLFFKHSVIYGFSNILSRGISLLLVPLYTRVLSPADYGALDILTITGNFVNLLITMEITQAFARFSSEIKTDADRTEYASTTLWYLIGIYFAFTVSSLFFSKRLTLLLMGAPEWEGVVRLVILSIAANGIFNILQSQLRWSLQTRNYAVVSIVVMLVSTSTSAFLVLVQQYGVAGIVSGQILGAIAGGWLSYAYSRNHYRPLFVWKKCKDMLVFSLPLVPSSINVFIAFYLDRIAIKQLMTLGDVGLYGVGYRFASVVSILMIGINTSLTPLIYNRYKLESTPGEIARIFRYFLMLALPAVIMIAAFAREALILLTTANYYAAWTVIPVISCGILISSMYIFMPGMDIAKKTKRISAINITAGLANIPLNFLLIPYLGIMGAALATLCSSLIMFTQYVYFSQKLYFVPHNWRRIVPATLVAVAAIACYLVVTFPPSTAISLLIAAKAAISLLAVVLVVWLLIESDDITKFGAFFSRKPQEEL
jgi:O-antigen/teichoic acid export membrane protein